MDEEGMRIISDQLDEEIEFEKDIQKQKSRFALLTS
jgi:hypothetical protein